MAWSQQVEYWRHVQAKRRENGLTARLREMLRNFRWNVEVGSAGHVWNVGGIASKIGAFD